jgi:hypothetical protein
MIRANNPGDHIESTENYLVVAFSTHARNLIEFFHDKKAKIKVTDYVNTFTIEEVEKEFPEIQEYYDILCQNHSHLHYRILENKGISPVQIVFPLYKKLKIILIKFLKELPGDYKTREMLDLSKCFEQE